MRQPLLHDLVTCLDAPSLVLSEPDGQIRPGGVQGWFRADHRLLDSLTVRVGGQEPTPLAAQVEDARTAVFSGVLTHLGDEQVDPTVLLHRRRHVLDGELTETLEVVSTALGDVEVDLEVVATADFAAMQDVRRGTPAPRATARSTSDGLAWAAPDPDLDLTATADPAPDAVDVARGSLRWRRRLRGHDRLEVSLVCRTTAPPPFRATTVAPWRTPEVTGSDPRLGALVTRGLDDLHGLSLADPEGPDVFVAAGSPWYLTLFGRDSLWTARMLLPVGTSLALSTLRALARRQGTRVDPDTEEQPGKILHEVRAGQHVVGEKSLPPVYYGTVDATPLFVVLLAEAWRWGADRAEVEDLLPHAEAALRCMEEQAGEGFLRYVDSTGRGLSNQGWKDSDDAISWADGRLAEAPIALSEVQAYAYQAAMAGADLLDDLGRPGAGHWRDWAGRLAHRFRERFWVEDERGPYPAVALDRDGQAVDSVASNMGHLLGTGLLEDKEAHLVAARLTGDDMDSGFGLRTLSSRSPRYSPLSYHGGSVWPHDTAVAVHGLCREGRRGDALTLLRGLVAAAPAFDHRLPELYAGTSARRARSPLPYPTSCRPQAWAAAAPLWAVLAVLGVEPDAPQGVVRVAARVDPSFGPLRLDDLEVAGHRLDVAVAADGTVEASSHHPHLQVLTVG